MAEPLSILMASGLLAADEVIRIGRDIAAALHGVHGELRPGVILVSGDRVEIEPPGETDRMRYGQYAAPERVLGKPATPVSDVFSIAAILFHALAGRPPFRGETPQEVMLSACADVPLDLLSSRDDLPPKLTELLVRSLSRDPGQRPPTPAAFADALEAVHVRINFPGRRVLVADDDGAVRDFYARVIARVGVDADVVSGGRDAIEALKTSRYDLALLDLNMPRLSGWEVLDFIRARSELRPQKVFVVTGFSDQVMSDADRDLVSAVLYKPVAPEELRNLVTQSLRGGVVDLESILRTTSHRAIAL